MDKNAERVEMTVYNVPGTLGRVTGQIRKEGWNIERLLVEETENEGVSRMEIFIGGKHNKLTQVTERMLGLDCVLSISMMQNGEKVTRIREIKKNITSEKTETVREVPEKAEDVYRILVINPGSTSTKFAVYDDETAVLEHTLRHEKENGLSKRKDLMKSAILSVLSDAGITLGSIDAITGRGGLLKPIESGTYKINEAMLRDLNSAAAAVHASALGALTANEIAEFLNIDSYVVDPIVVDEMDRNAKLTGFPGIERSSVFHALNQKAVARRACKLIGKPYENARLAVAHLGGGITVGAHKYGRVIDVNDALSGEGPFTPERSGGVPAAPLIKMCFSGEYTEKEMLEKIVGNGGLKAYLGTNDLRAVQKMINDGDEFAALVMDSMAYQVSKEIGAMSAVLEGHPDAVILTGGLAHSNRFTGAIKQRVDKFAPVYVFPGEDEMSALMSGVLRVLKGEEKAAVYE